MYKKINVAGFQPAPLGNRPNDVITRSSIKLGKKKLYYFFKNTANIVHIA